MRLDKYLKVSRIIKRRTVANEACDAGRVMVNEDVYKRQVYGEAGKERRDGMGYERSAGKLWFIL